MKRVRPAEAPSTVHELGERSIKRQCREEGARAPTWTRMEDIVSYILSFLDWEERWECGAVCRTWRSASQHMALWTTLSIHRRALSVATVSKHARCLCCLSLSVLEPPRQHS